MSEYTGRLQKDGNVLILDGDEVATRIILERAYLIYPIGSAVSCVWEHPKGIALEKRDAKMLGIEIEVQ